MTFTKKKPDLEAPLVLTPAPSVPLFRRGAALGSALALGVSLAAGCGDDGEPPMAVMGDTGTVDTGTADTGADSGADTGPPPPMPPPIDSGTGDAARDASADAGDTFPPPPMPPPPDAG